MNKTESDADDTMNDTENKFNEKTLRDTTETKWTRSCPKCGKISSYSRYWGLTRAIKNMSGCKSCATTGNKNPIYGTHRLESTKKKLSKATKNWVGTDSWNAAMRKAANTIKNKETHFWSGKHIPSEVKIKIRKSIIKSLKKRYPNWTSNYNPSACKVFEQINKKLNWNGQHAENGGEYHIKELGYWVDYYEPNLNIVIEYDEKEHRRLRYKTKDVERQKEIEAYLGCRFYRIREGED